MTKDEFIKKWSPSITQYGRYSHREDMLEADLILLLNQHLHDFVDFYCTESHGKYIANSVIGRFNQFKEEAQ